MLNGLGNKAAEQTCYCLARQADRTHSCLHPDKSLPKRTTEREIPCYSALAVPNNRRQSNESIKHSQLSKTVKLGHIIFL